MEWSEGERGRVGALINDVRRGQAVMGRKGSADSMKSGIMIGERPLALLFLSFLTWIFVSILVKPLNSYVLSHARMRMRLTRGRSQLYPASV